MPRKTKADLIAENERLRSKIREVYAAYYDMHARWEKQEDMASALSQIRHQEWRIEEKNAEIAGMRERIERLKAKTKKKAAVKA